VEFLLRTIRLYTPSRSESVLANMLREACVNELGFEEAHIDSVGNVIATKGSGDPRIMLCGHMDTVPGETPVMVKDGLIYGRGSSDAKAALIAMLLAASEFPKQRGTVIFAAVVDEEGNATGIKQLVKSRFPLNYAIFGEPSGIKNITIGYKGRLEIRLTCDVGDSTHASAPWLAKNSIEEAYNFWSAIKSNVCAIKSNVCESESGIKRRTDSISCSLTEITGGSSHNVTPQKCRTTLDIRIPTSTTCDTVLEQLNRIIEKVAADRGVKARYRIEDKTEPFEADHTSPLVRALSLSVLDVCKTHPVLVRKTGTGDMNILGAAFDVPVVTYGPGAPHSSHTPNEHVEISEYVACIDVFSRALFHLSRLHHVSRTRGFTQDKI
jgi:LysW-gamma-L-lysine carboxypeptidase